MKIIILTFILFLISCSNNDIEKNIDEPLEEKIQTDQSIDETDSEKQKEV